MVYDPPAASSEAAPARHTGTIVVGCLAVCLAQIRLVLPAAINGEMQRTLQTSGAELTWISDAFLVPAAVLALTFGVVGDRYGRKKLVVVAALLAAVGYLVSATSATLGPWLVTADELEPHRDADGFLDLALTVAVNGETVGRDRLADMAWTFEEMAAYASRGTWIRPGDVLGSGTCGNGGCLAELWGRGGVLEPPPLGPGDSVTMTVEGIGTISNTVVEGVAPMPVPPARRRR
ncbi:MFS transporter [Streptomyces sp. TRM70350]|uniref:MFS transporter n=1 Tax=Streptomyces sp. TRM70350 TaxID=2856165 RepID=UPI00210F6F88|nr:MFS transporter [Streptomyces sp. TRM70350]